MLLIIKKHLEYLFSNTDRFSKYVNFSSIISFIKKIYEIFTVENQVEHSQIFVNKEL